MGHCREKTGLEGGFHLASAGRGSDGGERGVGGSKGAKEELGAEEGEVVVDGEDLGLRVQVIPRGHPQRPSGYPKGGVLNPLELEHSRGWGVGKPDGSGVGEKGTD